MYWLNKSFYVFCFMIILIMLVFNTVYGKDIKNSSNMPSVDIEANGLDGLVTVPFSENLSLSVSLDPGKIVDQNADWWIASYNQLGWKSFVINSDSYGWEDGIKRCIEMPLVSLDSVLIPQPLLSTGKNTIIFAVDDNADGKPNVTWWDAVEVVGQNELGVFKVVPISLSTTSFKIKVDYLKTDTPDASYKIIGDKYSGQGDIDFNNETGFIEFSNLSPDTSYNVTISGKSSEISIGFKTFSNEKNLELFYFIDITDASTGTVSVHIAGHSSNKNNLKLKPEIYHTAGEYLSITKKPQLRGYSNSKLSFSENEVHITDIQNKYFMISYESDKSFNAPLKSKIHGYQGILNENYFMASGEQFILAPNNELINENQNKVKFSGTLIRPSNWKSETGYLSNKHGVFEFKPFENFKFGPVNIFSYNPQQFTINSKKIGGTEVNVILENSLNSNHANDIMDLYNNVYKLWDGGPGDDLYTIMVVDNDKLIYAGEWTTGQGYSSGFNVTGQMLVHQIYHRWNAWAIGIDCDHSDLFCKNIWNEGFNEFFCDLILYESGYDYNHTTMKGRYYQYKEAIANGEDQNLYTTHIEDLNDPNSVYYKGAVIAYALDAYVRKMTNNEYDLSYSLKRSWEEWKNNDKPVNLAYITEYLNEVVPGGVDDWVEKYIKNNKEITLPEFEKYVNF